MSRSREPYHHGDLKRALLDEAFAVVEKEGPEGLSFRRLAEAVKVSHAAPLAHFPDRLSLDAALATRGFQQLRAFLTQRDVPRPALAVEEPQFLTFRASSTGGSPPGAPRPTPPLAPIAAFAAALPSGPSPGSRRLVATALAYLRFALEHPGLYRVMHNAELSERLRDEPSGERESPFHALKQEKAGIQATFVELVVAGQQRGEIRRETSADELARLFTALAEGLAQQFIAEKLSTRTARLEDAEHMFGLLVEAVASRSP